MPDSRWKHQNIRKNKTNHKNCLCAFALAMINNITLIKGFTMELSRSLTRSLARLLGLFVAVLFCTYIYICRHLQNIRFNKTVKFYLKMNRNKIAIRCFLVIVRQSVGRTYGWSVGGNVFHLFA